MVINSDVFADINLNDVLKFHKEKKSKLTSVTLIVVQTNAKMQVQALTLNYKPFNESTKKVSQSKRAEAKAASEQK